MSPSVPPIAGRAVATMVWSTAAMNIGSMIEGKTVRNSDRPPGSVRRGCGSVHGGGVLRRDGRCWIRGASAQTMVRPAARESSGACAEGMAGYGRVNLSASRGRGRGRGSGAGSG